MKTIWLQVALLKRAAVACRPWLAAAVVLLAPGAQARADLREAVKKLLPATVAVEWRSVDTESARRTEVIRLENAKAEAVANAVKDVYRDRLSDPDKSPGGKDQQQQGADGRYGSPSGRKTPKGKGGLSIGVDAMSNSVIVSAPGSHFGEIKELIQALDEASEPSAEAIDESSQGNRTALPPDPELVQQALNSLLARPNASAAQAPKTPDTVVLASGTVLSSDGLIATLPGEAGKGTYTVTFSDGRGLPARLLVDDRRTGLKLLKVDADKLPYVELADEEAELGQQAVAVLSTDVTNRAVAQGIVTAKMRRHTRFAYGVLQTDFSAPAMSAGAPVADVQGRVLGVVTGTGGQGVAFSVPADYVKSLMEAQDGDETVVVHRPVLGVQMEASTKKTGTLVARVLPDSAAAAAGIREGDEITAVDGHNIVTPEDVTRYVLRRKPGDQATVVIRRDGKEKKLKATLGANETKSQTTKTGYVKVEAVRPERMYIIKDGQLEVISPNNNTSQAAEALKSYMRAQRHVAGGPTTIRVQRSDVEKKLDQLNGDVQSLVGQVQKLIQEVAKLRSQPESDSPPEK